MRERRRTWQRAIAACVAAGALVLGGWLAQGRAQAPANNRANAEAVESAPLALPVRWPADVELMPTATAALAARLRASAQRNVKVEVRGEPARGWFFAAVEIEVNGDPDAAPDAATQAALDGVRTWLATTPVQATAAPPANALGGRALELIAEGPSGRMRGLATAGHLGPGRVRVFGLFCVARGPAKDEVDRCLAFLAGEKSP